MPLNILCCVKRVPMTGGRIVLTADEQAIETRHLGFTISPHEECGVEEAVRLIEANGGSSTVLTLGPAEAEEQLRDCMALGIDRAVHLLADDEFDGQATARAIVDVIAAEREAGTEYDIVFFGNESADAGNYQVGIRVAHALGRPCVTGVKAVALEDGGLRCEQEVAGGRDVYRVPLPAVVTVKEGLNLPRYPSVPGPPAGEEEAARRPDAGAGCPGRREGAPRRARRRGLPDRGAGSRRRRRTGRGRAARPDRGPVMTAVLVLVEHDGGAADDLSRQAATLARGYAEAAGEPLEAIADRSLRCRRPGSGRSASRRRTSPSTTASPRTRRRRGGA